MSKMLITVEEIAEEAGKICLNGFLKKQEVCFKGKINLVTKYDYLVEEFILSKLKKYYPKYGTYSEEFGRNGDTCEGLWLIDPIDGTTNYAHGFPIFAISIALVKNNQPVLGVVHDPLREKVYSAELHKGARLNGEMIHVTEEKELNNSLIATGFPYDIRTCSKDNLTEFTRVIKTARGLRHAGSATLNCVWVASGRIDGYWEFGTKPWDTAAGALIVKEAGGKVTTINNKKDFLGEKSIVVTNGNIHDELIAVLNSI
jgi:myo-inositol-1(or 4)-monophosphatase